MATVAKETNVDVVMAAQRDASWYDRPNTRSVKVWHIVSDNDCRSACGLRVLMDDDGSVEAKSIHEPGRCRRRGCAERWPAR